MRYAVIFILVFLTGFGILQLMNSKEETPSPIQTPEQPETTNAIDSSEILASMEEEDTTSYAMIDGHYEVTWKHLSNVKFEEKMNTEHNTMIAYPIFHPSIKKLDGKKIQLKGYVIPFEETGDETIVILSAFPFTSCFFCGGAGPETVMDVQLKEQGVRFKQDAIVTFRGKLRLNDSDLDYLNYILDDAEVLD